MARGSGFVSRLGSGARHLERLEAPVGVEDGHERYVVVLLPPLHGVERGGDGRVVAHVDEQRRGLDVGVVAVLVRHEVVRVVPRTPPADRVALPHAEGVADGVVPVHLA